MNEREFFRGNARARAVYRAIRRVVDDLGAVEARVSKSQIGFYRDHAFAAVWKPGQYLKGDRPALVLTIFLRRRDSSDRWTEIVEPQLGRFTHHLELDAAEDVNEDVRRWISEAWRESA